MLGRLVPDLFLFFKKALYKVKEVVYSLVQYILIVLNLTCNKTIL